MGLELWIGGASLPEVETFGELVEAAYAEMKGTSLQHSEETPMPGATSVRGQVASQ